MHEKDPGRRRLSIGRLVWLLGALLFPGEAFAFHTLLEARAGYDSNPALAEEAEGSGFSLYAGEASHAFQIPGGLLVDLSLAGGYQQFWETEDNYRVGCGGALSYPLADGRVIPSLVGGVTLYRDALLEADERNTCRLGLDVDWRLAPWVSLSAGAEGSWLSFLNPSMPYSERGQGRGSGGSRKGGQGKGKGDDTGGNAVLDQTYPARDDFMASGSLGLTFRPASTWTVSLDGVYRNLSSSLSLESYEEVQGGVTVFWDLAPSWRAEGAGGLTHRCYAHVPATVTEVRQANTGWFTNLQVRRAFGAIEVFGLMELRRGQAPFHYTTFTQTVIQCGLSWSFSP